MYAEAYETLSHKSKFFTTCVVLYVCDRSLCIISVKEQLLSVFTTLRFMSGQRWRFRGILCSREPEFSQYGKLRSGTKWTLLSCLEKNGPAQEQRPSVEALLLDGAAIINILKPGASKTFHEYSKAVFLPYIINRLRNVERVDVVWVRYLPSSLNDSARIKRGKGMRRRFGPDTRILGDWTAFLRVDENKHELFLYLAEQLTTIGTDHGEVVSTEQLLLHAADLARSGYTKVMIRSVDTDVVVIAVAKFRYISLSELWIDFGVGKHLKYLPAHDISRSIGKEKSQALLAFSSFTGCDETSSFAHYGKKKAWGALDDVTEAFKALSNASTVNVVDEVMPILERYVTIMYDPTSTCMKVTDARRDLFTRKGRDLEAIPPPQMSYANMKRGPRIKLATAGAIPWCRLLRLHFQVSGAG